VTRDWKEQQEQRKDYHEDKGPIEIEKGKLETLPSQPHFERYTRE